MAFAQTIVCAPQAPANLKLAAKEIRRYVYLRTGELLPSAEAGKGIALKINPSLGLQDYRITADGITGGSEVGVLYGAYRYAELLGVRFYLHGDVAPDERLKELPVVKEEAGKPLFNLRGVNPWGAHPFGIDAWSADDYMSIFTQLTKTLREVGDLIRNPRPLSLVEAFRRAQCARPGLRAQPSPLFRERAGPRAIGIRNGID